MHKRALLSAASLLAASLVAGTAQAAPFNAVWTGTVFSSDVPGISVGNTATIIVTLDNGGTSAISQTWTEAHLLSVRFEFGTTQTTFTAPFGGSLNTFVGSYATDASGVLISVPELADSTVGTDYTTTLTEVPRNWFLNGYNGVFFTVLSWDGVYIDTVDYYDNSTMNAARWTLTPAGGGGGSAVPELDAASGTGALTLLLGALSLVAERHRKSA